MKKYTIILFAILVALLSSCKTTRTTTTVAKVTDEELVKFHLAEALREMLYDDYDEALTNLNKCVEADPKNSAVYYEFAEVYTQKEEYNIAISYMLQAVELSPENIFYKYYLAKLHIKNYDVEKSIPLFEEVVLETKSYTPFYELAHYYKYLKEYTKAIYTYERLQEKEGVTEFNTNQKLIVLDGYNNKKEYLKELLFVVDYFPYNADYKTRLITYYLENDNISEASKILSEDENMESAEYYTSFAEYYKGKNNYDSTYIFLKLGLEKETNFFYGLHILNDKEFFSSKNYPNSEVDTLFNLLINSELGNNETSLLYSKYLLQNNKPYSAIRVLEDIYSEDDFDYNLNKTITKLYLETNNYTKLDTISLFLMDLYPNMPEFYLYAGISNMMLNDYEKAEQLFKSGMDLIYSDMYMLSQFNFYLSYLYILKKDEFNTEKYYKEALKLSDTYYDLQNNYALFLIKNNTELPRVETLIKTCLENEPESQKFLYTSAYYDFKTKNYEQAIVKIKELIEKSETENAKYNRLYGDILLSQNKKQEAEKQWQKAKELDPK